MVFGSIGDLIGGFPAWCLALVQAPGALAVAGLEGALKKSLPFGIEMAGIFLVQVAFFFVIIQGMRWLRRSRKGGSE